MAIDTTGADFLLGKLTPPPTNQPTIPPPTGNQPPAATSSPTSTVTVGTAKPAIGNVTSAKQTLDQQTSAAKQQLIDQGNKQTLQNSQDPIISAAQSNTSFQDLLKSNPAAAYYRTTGQKTDQNTLNQWYSQYDPNTGFLKQASGVAGVDNPQNPPAPDKTKDIVDGNGFISGTQYKSTGNADTDAYIKSLIDSGKTEQATIAAQNATLQKASDDVQAKYGQILNGTYPLTDAQQQQVNSLQATFDQEIRQQQLANQNYTGGVTAIGIAQGINRYAPMLAIGNIQASVSAGIQKITDIQAKAASAIAQLKQGFFSDDLKLIQSSYDTWLNTQKDIQSNIDKLQTDTLKFQTDIRTAQQQEITNQLNSEKFTYQQKQDAIDNAFKTAQITETQRHNMQDELTAQQDVAIKRAELAIKQKEFNATYGQFTGNSANMKPQDIPGVLKDSTTGAIYFDPNQISDPKLKAAADNVARKAGIAIVDPKDTDSVNSVLTALKNLNQITASFKEIANSNFATANTANIANPVSEFFGTRYGNNVNSFITDRNSLFQFINALATSHPRINQFELTSAANSLPSVSEFNHDTYNGGLVKLAKAYGHLNNALSQFVPNYQAPKLGLPVTSLDEARAVAGSLGKTQALEDILNNPQYKDIPEADMIQFLNGSFNQ